VVNNSAKNGTFKPAILGTFVPALTVESITDEAFEVFLRQTGW